MSGETPERGFPEREFENRLERAQFAMAEAGFNALLLTSEPEVRYFSGFLTQFWQSPTRPWFLVVPAQGKPIAVIPEIGAALMRKTWLDDIRTWASPHPTDDGVTLLREALREVAGEGVIGTPMGRESHLRMPLKDFKRLTDALGRERFRDASPMIRKLRMVKSEAEITKITHICAIASSTFEAGAELFREGQPLSDAFRAFKTKCLEFGADDVPYLVGGAGLGGYDDVISPPSDAPLARGDVLMLDTGAVFDGYFCDFDRNYAIGEADDAAKRAHDILFLAVEAGIAAARPGATCSDLYNAMRGVIAEAGGADGDVGRLGHGLGMQLTEWPSLTDFDETVLEPGMVLTLEPATRTVGSRIMVHEENIVVRDDGAELLTRRTPRELPMLTAP
ncbi:aminopeptidase P family protein [Rhizobiales bacterium]|uniref:M24 family metallopeptidase n=1 Tax=Hongsoonwoonella zoysiae TaxID=2821844 RepID=UPI00155FBB4A|nr:Xaa-Pro peptidase family protein [Hongsoonwoonella zoysiae]NRG18527.1 aminopeptidase P family protein [Hongsoonwoonella zoysiae]